MTDHAVSNWTELASALSSAASGDTITLANGNYGDRTLTTVKTGYVTIRAANRRLASFDNLDFIGAQYLRFEGLVLNDHQWIQTGSHHLQFDDCELVGGMFFNTAGNFSTVNDCEITGEVVTFQNVNNMTFTNNYLHASLGDQLEMMGVTHTVLVEGNEFGDHTVTVDAENPDPHPDKIQLKAEDGHNPTNITIRKNLLWDNDATGDRGAQGISMSDPGAEGWEDILIEENLIQPTLANAMTCRGCSSNVIIRNNTMASQLFFYEDNSGVTIEDNILSKIVLGTGGETPSGSWTFNHNYEFETEGDAIEDILPDYVDGSDSDQWRPGDDSPVALGNDYGAQTWWSATEEDMAYLADSVLDAAIAELVAEGARLDICSQEPTTYTQATSTYSLGNKTGLALASASNGPTSGRKTQIPTFTNGSVTADGTATHWALTDGSGALLAANSLSVGDVVVNGNTWALTAAINVIFEDAVTPS